MPAPLHPRFHTRPADFTHADRANAGVCRPAGLGDRDAIDALRDGIARKAGVKVAYNAADMSKPAEIAGLVADTQARLGGIDILVNNAGIQHVARVENFPPDKWDAIIAINLSASFHTIRAALPAMKQKGWGRVINIASTHGLVASRHKVAYVAAKHGLIGLTKVMGIECADTGVTCNAICPGFVSTPLALAQIEVLAQQELLHLLHRALHRGQLEEDLHAGLVLLDHPLDTLHLAFDPAQPAQRLRRHLALHHRVPALRPPGGARACAAPSTRPARPADV